MHALRSLRLLVCAASVAATLAAQTPEIVVIFKGPGFRQTGPTTLEPFRPGFAAIVGFTAPVALATTVQLVGQGVNIPLTRVLADTYYLEQYFENEAALNAALPPGSYNVTVGDGINAPQTTPVTIATNVRLQPPLFSDYEALQNWSGGPLTLQWQPIAGASREDLINVTIERADGTELYSSPSFGEAGALDGTATSVTVPSLNVPAGETVFVSLTYVQFNLTLANNNRTAIASGRGFFLRAPITRAVPTRPVIAVQPRSLNAVAGSTVVLSVGATGSGLSYQWRRNGVPITGGASASLILSNVQADAQAFYTVDVTNSTGSVTSESVTITVVPTSANPGRISNLAIRSQAGSGAQTLIVGFAVSGVGTKPLLLRGVGPALGAFGVTGALSDPRLEVFRDGAKIIENDNWAGDAQINSIGTQVGAFALGAATGRDAALYNPTFAVGTYSIQVTGAAGQNGVALAEIYDATPPATFTASTPRLTNVSARTQVGVGGDVLIAGFAISGEMAKTVLIRAIGPTLRVFGVPGALPDARLEVYSGSTLLQSNDDWGGSSTLAGVFTSAGAFAIPAASRDAALVMTLPPGSYTAQVSGVNNTTGVALVEVYEVP